MKKKNDDDNIKDKEKKGIVESFLGGMPGFGDFFKELGKNEVFQERFKEANEKIEENLRHAGEKKWSVEGNISVRPLSMGPMIGQQKKESSELSIQKDYAYGTKDDKLMLAVKVPQEDVSVTLTGRNVMVRGDNFQKKIELPRHYKSIKSRQYKNGILALELVK